MSLAFIFFIKVKDILSKRTKKSLSLLGKKTFEKLINFHLLKLFFKFNSPEKEKVFMKSWQFFSFFVQRSLRKTP